MSRRSRWCKQPISSNEDGVTTGRTMSKTTARRPTLSRLHKPADLPLDAWQRELRRQFGREQRFRLENTGHEAVFSDYQVTNAQSKATYVAMGADQDTRAAVPRSHPARQARRDRRPLLW